MIQKKIVFVLVIFGFFLCWLFFPIFPKQQLICALPPNMLIACETNNFSEFWLRLQKQKKTLSLFSFIFSEKQWQENSKDINFAKAKLNEILSQPFGLGLLVRSLRGSLAIAIYPPDGDGGNDIISLMQLDNVGLIFFTLYLWHSAGILYDLDKERLWAVRDGDILVIATKKSRLQEAQSTITKWRQNKEKQQSAMAIWLRKISLPSPSLCFWVAPNARARDFFEREYSTGIWTIKAVAGGLAPGEKGEINLHASALLALKPRVAENGENERLIFRDKPSCFLKTPGNAAITCEGWGDVSFIWQCLCNKLWNNGRPLRGCSQPLTVLAWEAIDQGIIKYSDGRFAFWLAPPLAIKDDYAVPPSPEIAGILGINTGAAANAEKAFFDLIGKAVALYAAPGGNELYQAVRQETRLEVEGKNESRCYRLRLHPLFFNHLDIAWTFGKDFCAFTSAHERLPQAMAAWTASTSRVDDQPRDALLDISLRWQQPEQVLMALRDIIEDKVVRHGFVSTETQAVLMSAADLLIAIGKVWPFLDATVQMEKAQNGQSEKNYLMTWRLFLSSEPTAGSDKIKGERKGGEEKKEGGMGW